MHSGPEGLEARFTVGRRLSLLALAAFLCGAPAGRAQDEVPVPAGPAAVRRLLGLDPGRPKEAFFLDVHQALVDGSPLEASWTKIPTRKAVMDFVEDLAEWKQKFGNPARLSASGREDWKKTERALEWLGSRVKGDARSFTTEQRDDEGSLRRRRFLETLGTPLPAVLARLRAGEPVSVAIRDEPAPLPFGLAAWRETLDEPGLDAPSAFVEFVRNVKASRMLVALHALDAETRDGLRTLLRDGEGRPVAWRILYDDALEAFARFPEALSLRDGRFLLPGGKEAEPVWTDILGVSPADRASFLTALYGADGGKAAYVVDVLQQLPEPVVRGLLLGGTGGGKETVKRFRRLYRAIEKDAASYALNRRVPYDFQHLARFLDVSGEGSTALWGLDPEETDFPRDESELAEVVSRASRSAKPPEEYLRRLFGSETWKAPGGVSAQQRHLVVATLLAARPNLEDRGLRILLFRGADRLLPAYGILEDLPIDPPLARRYLFTLDRLDRMPHSRDAEVAAGLFQTSAELLAQLARAGALTSAEGRELFAALLDVPLFSGTATAAQGEGKLYLWLSDRLLPALRASERRRIEAARLEQARRTAAYREALQARDERIESRRREARAGEEARRGEAEARLRAFLEPECPQDDATAGPHPPRFLREAQALGEGMEEALVIEGARSAPLTPEAPLLRTAGALPETAAIADSSEPLPDFVPFDVPEESASSDELLTRALVGQSGAAVFDWRGGRYRFDPAADEVDRRKTFCEKQRLAWLANLESIHDSRAALLAASGKGDLASARTSLAELVEELDLEPGKSAGRKRKEDDASSKQQAAARDAAADLARLSKPGQLGNVAERIPDLDAVVAEKHLEALLGHLYAGGAGDPEDIYYQDPGFVRRHAFRSPPLPGREPQLPFSRTVLTAPSPGEGSRITGSVFGLPDVLGLLHTDQVPRSPGSSLENEDVRSGLVSSIRRMSPALLDDDALRFVAASCRATEEAAVALGEKTPQERSRFWNDHARDLVPRARIGLVADLGAAASPEALAQHLSPSDLYRIGRRLLLDPARAPALPSAQEGRAAFSRLTEKHGEAGRRDRLSQFGPRAVNYAGRFRLTDLDLPPYERLAAYRGSQLLSDRVYDLKIAVARRVSEAGLPAAVLPLILPAALDEMIGRLKMAYGSDWGSVVRGAQAFTRADVDRLLERALETGRLARDMSADEMAAAE